MSIFCIIPKHWSTQNPSLAPLKIYRTVFLFRPAFGNKPQIFSSCSLFGLFEIKILLKLKKKKKKAVLD